MVREVAPDEVQAKLEGEEDVAVVDIRPRGAFAEGHLPGAINVPLPELPQRVEEHDWDADEVVCVCKIGQSSVQAARLLGSYEEIESDGVASMAGGYREWDGELETGDGAATREDGAATGNDAGGAAADGGGAADANDASDDEGPQAPF